MAESWRHRLVEIPLAGGTPKPVLADLPAYPARLAPAPGGGAWLALFAPRNRLIEMVLRERRYREDMLREIPREQWIDFSHRVIWHGRALCIARKPKCAECKLENICHAADKTWSTVDIHKGAKP